MRIEEKAEVERAGVEIPQPGVEDPKDTPPQRHHHTTKDTHTTARAEEVVDINKVATTGTTQVTSTVWGVVVLTLVPLASSPRTSGVLLVGWWAILVRFVRKKNRRWPRDSMYPWLGDPLNNTGIPPIHPG